MFRSVLLFIASFAAANALALDPALVAKLATGESDERIAAVASLAASGDERAPAVLTALSEGEMQVAGKQVLIVKGDKAVDAATGEAVTPLPAAREDVVANNRLRREIEGALGALKLVAPEREARL